MYNLESIHPTSVGFCYANGSPNLGQTTRLSDSQKKKKNLPNTENSPRDLRRFAVTQTPVRNHQPTLV